MGAVEDACWYVRPQAPCGNQHGSCRGKRRVRQYPMVKLHHGDVLKQVSEAWVETVPLFCNASRNKLSRHERPVVVGEASKVAGNKGATDDRQANDGAGCDNSPAQVYQALQYRGFGSHGLIHGTFDLPTKEIHCGPAKKSVGDEGKRKVRGEAVGAHTRHVVLRALKPKDVRVLQACRIQFISNY